MKNFAEKNFFQNPYWSGIYVKVFFFSKGFHGLNSWLVFTRDGQRYVVSTGGDDKCVFGAAVRRDVQLMPSGVRVFVFEHMSGSAVDMRRPALSGLQQYVVVGDSSFAAKAFGEECVEMYVKLFEFGPEVVVKPSVE